MKTLIVILIIVIIKGVFSAAETAFAHLNKSKIHQMSKKNKKAPTRMKMRLKDLGLSQTELARRVNKNVSLINHFCVHGVKTVRVAKEYARILCCRPEELLDL